MKTLVVAMVCAVSGVVFSGSASASQSCGDITVAKLNWSSAAIAAWVDKLIMEDGFGCTVRLVEGDTDSTLTSMIEAEEPDVIPEYWFEGITPELALAVSEKRVAYAAALLSEGGVQGWWMPKFVADANPDIKTVQQALQHPELFLTPSDNQLASVFNCLQGWSCHTSTLNLFRALGAGDKGFQLVDPQTTVDLEETIAQAFEGGYGWLGYLWTPTALLGKYDMVKLSFDVDFDKTEWDRCTIVVACPDPKLNAYPVSAVYTLVTGRFLAQYPKLMDYLNARTWSNGTINEVMAWKAQNNASNEAAARYFIKNYPDIWKPWLTKNVALIIENKL